MATIPVCLSENLTTNPAGDLQLQPWASVRLVVDTIASSAGDGSISALTALPGKLLIDKRINWTNDAPIPQGIMIRLTRGPKQWLTSNPNAIQFRDRYTHAVNKTPDAPLTTSLYNSQAGSALDVGTDSVAQPNAGQQWMWTDATTTDEFLAPLNPGDTLNTWYRMYVWTPPPFSNNANLNNPHHAVVANWARLQLFAYPLQGTVVTG